MTERLLDPDETHRFEVQVRDLERQLVAAQLATQDASVERAEARGDEATGGRVPIEDLRHEQALAEEVVGTTIVEDRPPIHRDESAEGPGLDARGGRRADGQPRPRVA